MLLLNFSHPLTTVQYAKIEALAGTCIEEVRTIPVQIDQATPLERQITLLVDSVGLSSDGWQTCPLLINPPGYALVASALLAELHGRIGHFPSIVRICPAPQPGPTTVYEVAELLNLQTLRESARQRR
jgi:hypothetical protein